MILTQPRIALIMTGYGLNSTKNIQREGAAFLIVDLSDSGNTGVCLLGSALKSWTQEGDKQDLMIGECVCGKTLCVQARLCVCR